MPLITFGTEDGGALIDLGQPEIAGLLGNPASAQKGMQQCTLRY